MDFIQTAFAFTEHDASIRDATLALLDSRKKPIKMGQRKEAKRLDYNQLPLNLPLLNDDDAMVRDVAVEITPQTIRDERQQVQRAASAPNQALVQAGFRIEDAAMWQAKFLYRMLELLLWSKEGTAGIRREILDWIFATGWTWSLPSDWNGWAESEQEGVRRPRRETFVGPPTPELVWTHAKEGEAFKTHPKLHLVPFSFEACCWVEEIPAQRVRDCIEECLRSINTRSPGSRQRAALH